MIQPITKSAWFSDKANGQVCWLCKKQIVWEDISEIRYLLSSHRAQAEAFA